MEAGLATEKARGILLDQGPDFEGSRYSQGTMSTHEGSAVTEETADHSTAGSADKKKKSKKEKKEKKSKKEKKHKDKKEKKSIGSKKSASSSEHADELHGIEIRSGFNPQLASLKAVPPSTPWESMTPHTERTSTTMSSLGSNDVPPPVRMIECVDDEELQQAMLLSGRRPSLAVNSTGSEPKEAAAYHGEMLQSFLRQHGQDDKLAVEQAVMFEAFLKSQQDALSHLTPMTIETNQTESIVPHKGDTFDDEEDTRLDHMESLLDDADSFADHWENGTFTSFTVKSEGPNQRARMMEQAFGTMRRNEDFMRRRESESTGANSAPAAIPAPPMLPRTLGVGTTDIPQHMMKAPPPSSLPEHTLKQPPLADSDNKSISASSNRSFGTNGSYNEPSVSGSFVSNHDERPIADQLGALSASQKSCFYSMKSSWEEGEGKTKPFTDEYYLRFCKCSPGKPFTAKNALKIMRKFERRYLSLSVMSLEGHLKTMSVFPVPGLKTAAGREIFFIKMSRYSPKQTPIATMIDTLVYVMNCMLEKEKTCGDGLAVVADFTDFKMSNFSVSYISKLMMALQGRKNPTRVCLFLLVNPPSWFGSIYSTIMQPMMSEDFRKRVHRINEKDLKKYLNKGYEQFLPSELSTGRANSQEMVKDFIMSRKQLEGQRLLESVGKE